MLKAMNSNLIEIMDSINDVDAIESIFDGQIANMVKYVVQTAVADGSNSDTVNQIATAYLDDFEILTLHIWERHIVPSVQYDRMISHFIETYNALAYSFEIIAPLDETDDADRMHWIMW